MKLFNIDRIDAFMNCVHACEGMVDYTDSHGSRRDLKNLSWDNELMMKVIRDGHIDEIEVHAALKDDARRLMRYALESRG